MTGRTAGHLSLPDPTSTPRTPPTALTPEAPLHVQATERTAVAPPHVPAARSRLSFTDAFTAALCGRAVEVVGPDGEVSTLPVQSWRRVDAADEAMLAHCVGPAVDLGCGPGRMAARLAERGRHVLGVDVVAEAVAQTRRRGVPAVRRDVFDPLPGEGRWGSVLLADGNLGIGGDPLALLRRVRDLVGRDGRVVVELGAPGTTTPPFWSRLRLDGAESSPFRWARVGADAVGDLALRARLGVRLLDHVDGRWFAVLDRPDRPGRPGR